MLNTTTPPANRDHGPRTETPNVTGRPARRYNLGVCGGVGRLPRRCDAQDPTLPAPFTSMLRSCFDSARKALPGIQEGSLMRTMSSGVMGRPGPSRSFACKGEKEGLAGVGKAIDPIPQLRPALKSKGRQTPRGGGLSCSGRRWSSGPLCSASGHPGRGTATVRDTEASNGEPPGPAVKATGPPLRQQRRCNQGNPQQNTADRGPLHLPREDGRGTVIWAPQAVTLSSPA